nr:unnamed protein product [Callosobruchus chinensis]
MVEIPSRDGARFKPMAVIDYNKAKSFIDLSNQMPSYSTSLRRSIKWFKKIAIELILGASVVNAHQLFKLYKDDASKMSITTFKENLCMQLLNHGIADIDTVPVSKQHAYTSAEKRGRCKLCYQKNKEIHGREYAIRKTRQVNSRCDACADKPLLCLECFFATHNISAKNLTADILGILDPILENSKDKLIAQSYDGAAVMSGRNTGVQARIKEKYNFAHFVHCYAHQLNLIMSQAASQNHKFIFWLTFFHRIMPKVDVLFNELQKRKIDPVEINQKIQSFDQNIMKIRNSIDEIINEATNIISSPFCEPMPSKRRRNNDSQFDHRIAALEVSGSRKRKKNVASWKHNTIKTARVQGQAYIISTKGKKVDARTVGPPCSCTQKCMQQFTEEGKKDVMSKLYNRTTKNEQDTYLQGLMEVRPIQRHRIRNAENKRESKSNFSYFVMKGRNRIPLCKQAFISLHAISHWQVQRLNTLLLAAKSPKDLRGRHNNRPRAICDEWIRKIKEHIDAFRVKVSHYSSKTISYLDAALDMKKMHNLFVNKHPELENIVKYEFYLEYFNENFNLKFGRPQVDVCSECERHGTRLKDVNLNDNAKRAAAAELMVHKRRAKKFYTKINEVQILCTERPEVMGLAFDCMQNMPLPHIPVQEIFYYRQLWVYAFQIHNLKDNTDHFYTYHEGQGQKGPNEVCTFLSDYIMKHIPPEITELYMFSD